MSMTKAGLAADLARWHEISQEKAGAIIADVFGCIADELEKGNRVTIHSFGSFIVRTRKARRGTNPRTGKPMHLSPTRTVGFKPSSVLKERL